MIEARKNLRALARDLALASAATLLVAGCAVFRPAAPVKSAAGAEAAKPEFVLDLEAA